MANIRMSRINAEMQKAIAEIVNNRLHNPALDGLIISILDVDTAPDLSLAKVAVSVLSTDDTKKLVVDELNKAKGYIKRELMRMVRLRTTPDLVFSVDNSYERGQKILSLIDQISDPKED